MLLGGQALKVRGLAAAGEEALVGAQNGGEDQHAVLIDQVGRDQGVHDLGLRWRCGPVSRLCSVTVMGPRAVRHDRPRGLYQI